jgi:hypothetical protein
MAIWEIYWEEAVQIPQLHFFQKDAFTVEMGASKKKKSFLKSVSRSH